MSNEKDLTETNKFGLAHYEVKFTDDMLSKIQAKFGDIEATFEFRIDMVPMDSLTLYPNSQLTLPVAGATPDVKYVIKATYSPANAVMNQLTWSGIDALEYTVSEDTLTLTITGGEAGSYYLLVQNEEGVAAELRIFFYNWRIIPKKLYTGRSNTLEIEVTPAPSLATNRVTKPVIGAEGVVFGDPQWSWSSDKLLCRIPAVLASAGNEEYKLLIKGGFYMGSDNIPRETFFLPLDTTADTSPIDVGPVTPDSIDIIPSNMMFCPAHKVRAATLRTRVNPTDSVYNQVSWDLPQGVEVIQNAGTLYLTTLEAGLFNLTASIGSVANTCVLRVYECKSMLQDRVVQYETIHGVIELPDIDGTLVSVKSQYPYATVSVSGMGFDVTGARPGVTDITVTVQVPKYLNATEYETFTFVHRVTVAPDYDITYQELTTGPYGVGDTVRIRARLLNNGEPANAEALALVLKSPDDWYYPTTVDDDGYATFEYIVESIHLPYLPVIMVVRDMQSKVTVNITYKR